MVEVACGYLEIQLFSEHEKRVKKSDGIGAAGDTDKDCIARIDKVIFDYCLLDDAKHHDYHTEFNGEVSIQEAKVKIKRYFLSIKKITSSMISTRYRLSGPHAWTSTIWKPLFALL